MTNPTGRLRVLVLGSTGSIGTQALEVIAANPDRFEVVGLAAGGANVDTLRRQRAETGVTNIAVADERAAEQVGDVPFRGPDAVTRLIEETEADVVLNALVGALRPATDPGRAAIGRPAGAGQQGIAGRGWAAGVAGGAAGSDRAGRLRAFRAGAVPARREPPTRSPSWC